MNRTNIRLFSIVQFIHRACLSLSLHACALKEADIILKASVNKNLSANQIALPFGHSFVIFYFIYLSIYYQVSNLNLNFSFNEIFNVLE